MKAKKGFNLRSVCGSHFIVAEGKENIDINNLISMNESAAFLWKSVVDREFTPSYLAKLLTEEYEIDYPNALKDAEAIAAQWISAGIVEE